MRLTITVAVLALGFVAPASALTLKKGEVLGPDGNLYTGASPEQIERLIERAAQDDMPAGVVGNNVFIVVEDKVSFVPVSELSGKTKETQLQVIGDQVVQDITGNVDITFRAGAGVERGLCRHWPANLELLAERRDRGDRRSAVGRA